jgi:ketosteroid isomerase-like protein
MLATGAAVLVATGTSEAELADGRSFSSAFVHTVVFVERDGVWRVIHSHQSTPAPR